jgi:hypothetical protein
VAPSDITDDAGAQVCRHPGPVFPRQPWPGLMPQGKGWGQVLGQMRALLPNKFHTEDRLRPCASHQVPEGLHELAWTTAAGHRVQGAQPLGQSPFATYQQCGFPLMPGTNCHKLRALKSTNVVATVLGPEVQSQCVGRTSGTPKVLCLIQLLGFTDSP